MTHPGVDVVRTVGLDITLRGHERMRLYDVYEGARLLPRFLTPTRIIRDLRDFAGRDTTRNNIVSFRLRGVALHARHLAFFAGGSRQGWA